MFDANALTATSFHNVWWKILALGNKAWDVQILIPKVSFEEMVGHAERAEDKLIEDLKSIARKAGNTSGFQQAIDDLRARRQVVRANRMEGLQAIGATLVDPVPVDHLQIVRRQVQRVRPCKEATGDGYRDTLNWLTVLDYAANHPDQEVAWISADRDFAASERTFHAELLSEAQAAGVADRLSLWPTLNALVMDLLHKSELGSDAEAAHLALMVQSIQLHVAEEAISMVLDYEHFSPIDVLVAPKPSEVAVEQPSSDSREWPFTVNLAGATRINGVLTDGDVLVSGVVKTDVYSKIIESRIDATEWTLLPRTPSLQADQTVNSIALAMRLAGQEGTFKDSILSDDVYTQLSKAVNVGGLAQQLSGLTGAESTVERISRLVDVGSLAERLNSKAPLNEEKSSNPPRLDE
ncbi:PIN domain-containing protein [Nonomuraea sp. NPDC050310]|uniref:PIN domain-containing protein n=1 Tax=Nonomuraea sp. NPDC050310 TaxID=3154935 RepID=UPI003410FC8B